MLEGGIFIVELFYKYASFLFGLAGAAIALFYFAIHKYVSIYLPEIQGILQQLFVVILGLSGFFIGKLIRKLQYAASTDVLTDLLNRRYFSIKLMQEMNRMRRAGSPLCIALLDVDDFKKINDSFGHAAGDVTLVNIAGILKKNTRNIDAIFRWGGDEFAIIFSNTTLDGAFTVSERIRDLIATSTKATVSIGIIAVEEQWDEGQILIEVDEMLAKAKEVKNSVVSTNLIDLYRHFNQPT